MARVQRQHAHQGQRRGGRRRQGEAAGLPEAAVGESREVELEMGVDSSKLVESRLSVVVWISWNAGLVGF